MQEHAISTSASGIRRRTIYVANLDPAAEDVYYDAAFDVRDLISVEDVMTELGLGPNGALIYCMEYLLENLNWLHDELDAFTDEDYLILDCPGQLELYTHVPIMRRILDTMRSSWGFEGSMVSVFCVDAAFLVDASKFLSGSLLSLSAMIALELPHVNILTKCDLMSATQIEDILGYSSASQLWNVEQDRQCLIDTAPATTAPENEQQQQRLRLLEQRRRNRHRLTDAICQLLDDWQMTSFLPLNILDEDSIEHVLSTVDHTIQYGEDLEVRGAEQDDDLPDAGDNQND